MFLNGYDVKFPAFCDNFFFFIHIKLIHSSKYLPGFSDLVRHFQFNTHYKSHPKFTFLCFLHKAII